MNPRAGHQLNQHYLDSIFPLDPTGRFTCNPEKGDFEDMDVIIDFLYNITIETCVKDNI